MQTIISLTGNAGVGKDTMADYLVEKYGFVKIGLADPMKRIAKEVYEFSDEQLWGSSDSRNLPDERYPRPDGSFLNARVALQLLGNEWSRVCYPDTWTVYLRRIIEKVSKGYFYSETRGAYRVAGKQSAYTGIVISNGRFRNEIAGIKTMGGKAVRLRRPGLDTAKSLQMGVPNHASELEQMSIPDEMFDAVVEVPEGFEDFYREIDICLAKLKALPMKVEAI